MIHTIPPLLRFLIVVQLDRFSLHRVSRRVAIDVTMEH
jgi:hypothetical protein